MEKKSLTDRRQLFKDIWDTAMCIDEKDTEIMKKPKVIKTLRMDEVDDVPVGKKKKVRIKHLQIVCKKILDFCDHQDVHDPICNQEHNIEFTQSRAFQVHKSEKKKVKIKKSLFSPRKEITRTNVTTSDGKDDFTKFTFDGGVGRNKKGQLTRNESLNKQTMISANFEMYKSSKDKYGPNKGERTSPGNTHPVRRRANGVLKIEKRSKRKRRSTIQKL